MRHFDPTRRDLVLIARVLRDEAQAEYVRLTADLDPNADDNDPKWAAVYEHTGIGRLRAAALEAERDLVRAMFAHLREVVGAYPRDVVELHARWVNTGAGHARLVDLALALGVS